MTIFTKSRKPKNSRSRPKAMKPGSSVSYDDATEEIVGHAQSINLLPVDAATAAARPDTISDGYHEREFDALGKEQNPLWAAAGEELGRGFRSEMAGLKDRYDVIVHLITVQKEIVAAAVKNVANHNEVLQGRTRRENKAKFFYILLWVVFLGGDIAGIGGASILRGEIPELALLQAASAGAATVTAGLVGRDIRDARLARRRALDPAQLTPEQQKFAWIFSGPDEGEKLTKIMCWVGATVAVLIAGGIGALRADGDSPLAAIVYGSFAGGIALASAINSYFYADEVADLLERADGNLEKAVKRLQELAGNPVLREYAEAKSAAESIEKECKHRGIAGGLRLEALKHGVSRNNPAVFGHGPALTPQPAPTTPGPFQEPDFAIFEAELDDKGTESGSES
ncbi:hypothetical protein NFC73_11365 [Pseudarthrobacter sp. RMG13]|uniref:Uncharacterized protein n=1 Tax=Pseudarthrobacter humi TaxID=2952523 RepID=A0ABT1LPD9_9MICC|nr:hypothetical protein [Pseudarthrobacter humi]MCP9000322.1 hypothetical protein [Pseudarthrobacter humi]